MPLKATLEGAHGVPDTAARVTESADEGRGGGNGEIADSADEGEVSQVEGERRNGFVLCQEGSFACEGRRIHERA